MKTAFMVLLGIIACMASIVGTAFFGFKMYEYFTPKYTAVDNKVFHESQQYNDGMVRDLQNLKMQYDSATPSAKDALRSTIIHRFSIYPVDRMPANLQIFYSELLK